MVTVIEVPGFPRAAPVNFIQFFLTGCCWQDIYATDLRVLRPRSFTAPSPGDIVWLIGWPAMGGVLRARRSALARTLSLAHAAALPSACLSRLGPR